MAKVHFSPSGKNIEVADGVTLLDAAEKAGMPLGSSCGGQACCGKCNIQILQGADHVSPQAPEEVELLLQEERPITDRIACLAQVHGDCTITATYW